MKEYAIQQYDQPYIHHKSEDVTWTDILYMINPRRACTGGLQ